MGKVEKLLREIDKLETAELWKVKKYVDEKIKPTMPLMGIIENVPNSNRYKSDGML